MDVTGLVAAATIAVAEIVGRKKSRSSGSSSGGISIVIEKYS